MRLITNSKDTRAFASINECSPGPHASGKLIHFCHLKNVVPLKAFSTISVTSDVSADCGNGSGKVYKKSIGVDLSSLM